MKTTLKYLSIFPADSAYCKSKAMLEIEGVGRIEFEAEPSDELREALEQFYLGIYNQRMRGNP